MTKLDKFVIPQLVLKCEKKKASLRMQNGSDKILWQTKATLKCLVILAKLGMVITLLNYRIL